MKYYNLKTDYGRQQFYCTKGWKMLRNKKLTINPFCEECQKHEMLEWATQIDHIKDIEDRPDLYLTLSNLNSLCHSCHSKKTYKTRVSPYIETKTDRPRNAMWPLLKGQI